MDRSTLIGTEKINIQYTYYLQLWIDDTYYSTEITLI